MLQVYYIRVLFSFSVSEVPLVLLMTFSYLTSFLAKYILNVHDACENGDKTIEHPFRSNLFVFVYFPC
jgi:hypothetical protein